MSNQSQPNKKIKKSQSTKIFNNIKLTKQYIFSTITNAYKYLYKTK